MSSAILPSQTSAAKRGSGNRNGIALRRKSKKTWRVIGIKSRAWRRHRSGSGAASAASRYISSKHQALWHQQ